MHRQDHSVKVNMSDRYKVIIRIDYNYITDMNKNKDLCIAITLQFYDKVAMFATF